MIDQTRALAQIAKSDNVSFSLGYGELHQWSGAKSNQMGDACGWAMVYGCEGSSWGSHRLVLLCTNFFEYLAGVVRTAGG